jgi:hypothetical protein
MTVLRDMTSKVSESVLGNANMRVVLPRTILR